MGRPARHAGGAGRAGADRQRAGPDLSRALGRPLGRPLSGALPGAVASPNIWEHPATYEIENRAVDPDGRLWSTLRDLGDWTGRTVLDLGCGSGFHLPAFAAEPGAADRVVGVEPHADLARLAVRRTRRLPRVSVLPGTAQAIPLPDGSVDVVHVRWAYFFGPGCEPGLAELRRVVGRGGVALIVDNDGSRSTFGRWFRAGYPHLPEPADIERFWARHGFTRTSVDMGWRFTSRADLEAVVRIEFPPAAAERILTEHDESCGLEIEYAVNVWSRLY